ncbi:MAG: hypothetical protein IJN43_07735 [Ruminococcus sp.]|nr:hypothetical protein [Ruminococcus sp.]
MLPYLSEVQNTSKKYSVVFRGLNYGEGTQDGEFAETYNLSTDQYPCITQRAARLWEADYTKPTTLHAKGKLLVIDGTDVIYGGKKVGEVDEGKKQTATIGNYIVIFPDKKYYKVPTEDDKDGEFGSMEAEYKGKGLKFTASTISTINKFTASWLEFTSSTITIATDYKATKLVFTSTTISKTGANFPFKAGDVITISGCTRTGNNKTDITITEATTDKLTFASGTFANSYTDSAEVTISRKAKGKFAFNEGDTITVAGCTKSENNKDVVIQSATDNQLTFADGSFTEATEIGDITLTRTLESKFPFKEGDAVTITGCSANGNNKTQEIVIRGVSSDRRTLTFDDNAFTAVANEKNKVTISRTVPELDFICESNYRLWGTHGNTIYSSKFSDPFNFKVFDNLATDSYAIDVGSEGEFTGCIPYSSHICFFKENTLHKLYGTKPSNFQVTTVNVYGVQSGSEKSMQIVNEQLLYKGVGGVYSYTGGVPELISEKFGNKRYSDAVACCDGEKYYISMKQGDTYSMYAYDVMKNIWLREDDTHAVDMTFFGGKVYYLDAEGGLYYIDKTADRSDIEWGATFCTMHETINERKGYSKFHLRMDMSASAWLAVDIKTDNDLKWQQVYTTHNEKAKTVSIPIMPTRCDSIDIRLRGKGKCTIKAFIREFTVGSDV